VISGDLNSDLMSLNNNKLIDMMRLFNFKNVIIRSRVISVEDAKKLENLLA
jgi:hypothetical protein